MSIPPAYLDELRSRLTLSDVIGKRVKITRAGREYKACCPFHREKTPSFTINDDKQFYHCFGCGAHGDVIGFVMQHDNLSFIDTLEMLSAEAGLKMPEPDPKAVQKAEQQRDLHALMEEAAGWFQEQLTFPQNQDVRDYLAARGLSQAAIDSFRIGFAAGDHQALRKHLKQKGFADRDMILAGLVKESDKGGEPYVFFRDRVMFPVTDRRGRVIAFGGRILPDHMRPPAQSGFKPPKYLNSPDTPLFDKSRVLYGEAQARQAAGSGHSVLVTEGYMDVIACAQAGFKAAVAPMGTALTEEQVLGLWKMIPEDEKSPVLCFDGDNAGQHAAIRSCERILPLLKPGHSVRFAFLPQGEDPDSLIKSGGADSFKKVLKASLPLVEFIWHTHVGGRIFETPEARAGVIKKINDLVSQIADRDVQAHYRQIIRNKVSQTFFTAAPRSFSRGRSASAPAVKPRLPVSREGMMRKALLAAVLNYPPIFHDLEEELASLSFRGDTLGRLHQALIETLSSSHNLDSQQLKAHLLDQGLSKEMDDILSESVYVHAAFARPGGDSDVTNLEFVAQNWKELFKSLKNPALEQEIRDGWKQALEASNTEAEDKLKSLIQGKTSENL